MNTATPSLQGRSEPFGYPQTPAPGRRRRWPRIVTWTAVVVTLLLAATLIAASTVTVPYYAIQPGSARQVDDLIAVPPDQAHPPKGQVLLVTVGVARLTALGYLVAKRDKDVDVWTAKQYLGNQSDKQVNQLGRQEMVDSQNFAEVTALRRLGHPVVEQGEGATMEQVDPGTPAAGHLRPGDLVTVADGKPVAVAQDLRTEIQTRKPGDLLTLTVTGPESGATSRTENITLGPRPDNPKLGFLGVVFITHNQHFRMPFDIKIDSGNIGGPSAGLAFTLGLLDELTPGELTGGQKVAATGTIDASGNVGPIGGARQKTVAVLAQHAKVFLVPADDYKDAKARAGSQVKVIPVCTLEDALIALRSLGGDTSTLGPPPSTLATQPAPDCKIPAGAGR